MNAYRYRSMSALAIMQPLTYADKDHSYPWLPKTRFSGNPGKAKEIPHCANEIPIYWRRPRYGKCVSVITWAVCFRT